MKVEDAATANTGVWITFVLVVLLYAALGTTAIIVLRRMSRRFRREARPDDDESDVPVRAAPARADRRRGEGRVTEADVVAGVLLFGIIAYALFGGADFGAGFWDLIAGGAQRGARPRALIDHSIGPVWEANHVWLIFSLVVVWTAFSQAFSAIMLTLFVPLTLAALGIVLRGSSFAFRKSLVRTSRAARVRRDLRDLVGDRAVLHGRGRGRDRVGPRPRGRQGRRPVVELDQPDVDPRRRARGDRVRVPRGRVPRVGRAPPRRRGPRRVLPPPRGGCRGRGRRGRVRRDLRAPRRRDLRVPRPDVARAPARHLVGTVRRHLAGSARARRGARRAGAVGRCGRQRHRRVGRRAVAVPAPDLAEGVGRGRAVGHAHRGARRVRRRRGHDRARARRSSTCSTRRACCRAKAWPTRTRRPATDTSTDATRSRSGAATAARTSPRSAAGTR